MKKWCPGQKRFQRHKLLRGTKYLTNLLSLNDPVVGRRRLSLTRNSINERGTLAVASYSSTVYAEVVPNEGFGVGTQSLRGWLLYLLERHLYATNNGKG